MKKQKKQKKWKRIVDNKMKCYGDIDDKKKVIRIRKKPFKTGKWKKDEVINTVVHEEMHKNHPKMHEKTVHKNTNKILKKLSADYKRKILSRYKKK